MVSQQRKSAARSSEQRNQSLMRGLVFTYVSFIVLLPLVGLVWQTAKQPWPELWKSIASPVAIDAYLLTFGSSLVAATINVVFGVILAWILVRYSFPGKRIADGLVDLPFAMPGVVAGITLVSLYGPGGLVGQFLDPETPLGQFFQRFGVEQINLTASIIGVLLAQVYVTLPFVVRTVQPVLLDIEPEVEEVAHTLGANSWQSFWRVLFPQLLPAILTGFTLALARAIGEYGVVVIISGNMPRETLVSTVYIYQRLEEFNYSGATAVAIVLLLVSLLLLGLAYWGQSWSRRWGNESRN